MKKTFVKVLIVALIVGLVGGTVTSFGVTNKEKLNDINAQISKAKSELNETKKKANEVTSKINSLDQSINTTQNNIIKTQNDIQNTMNEIEQKIIELDNKNREMEKQNEDLNNRLRAMYKNGEVGYLEVILGSESFSELLNNVDMISRIYEQDEDFLELLKQQYEQIAQAKKDLEELKVTLEDQKAQLEQQKQTLESERSEAQALRAEIQTDIDAQNRMIDELNRSAEQITSLIQGSQSKNTTFVGGAFCLPATSYTRVSSYYGYRIHPITKTKKMHTGVDFAAPANTPCVAANSGTVTYAGWYSGYGNTVVIDHGGGISTLYAHNNSLLVGKGTKVTKGQQIAKIGSTGNSTGPHCHFEVRINGKHTNPMSYLGG